MYTENFKDSYFTLVIIISKFVVKTFFQLSNLKIVVIIYSIQIIQNIASIKATLPSNPPQNLANKQGRKLPDLKKKNEPFKISRPEIRRNVARQVTRSHQRVEEGRGGSGGTQKKRESFPPTREREVEEEKHNNNAILPAQR